MDTTLDDLKVTGHAEILFNFTWTIPRFNLLDARVGKKHTSEVFKLMESAVEWFVAVYPGGIHEPDKGYVSCFFFVENEPEGVKCKYNLSFSNTNDEVLFNGKSDEWIVCKDDGYGYRRTVATELLKSVLINDALVITMEVTYCASPVCNSVSVFEGAGIFPMMKMADDLKNLWISKKHSDLVISVGGKDIHVHSLILSARSKVFSAMFEHDMLEKSTRRLEVTDFESSTMESFVEFIYSGSVSEMNFDLALELLRASDRYEMDDLKMYCSQYLKYILNNVNVYQVLLSADIYTAEKLRSHAIEYFCKNLSEKNFASHCSNLETRPQLLSDIIKGMMKRYRTRNLL